jgi:hypothetical protein
MLFSYSVIYRAIVSKPLFEQFLDPMASPEVVTEEAREELKGLAVGRT